ncbi:MAG TPA: YcxB family protein [Acetivibrio clariflavus]|nr:YcxB family protein [Acetivibrio clariflavus]
MFDSSVKLYIKYTLKDIRDICIEKVYGGILGKIFMAPFIIVLVIAAVTIPVSLFFLQREPEQLLDFISTLLFLVFILGFIVNFPFVVIYLSYKNDYRKSKLWQSIQCVEVSKENLVISSEEGSRTMTWDEVDGVLEYRRCFFIHQSSAKIFVLPKRCFVSQEQLEEFRSILSSSLESNKLILKNYKLVHSCPDYCDTEFELKSSVLEKAAEGDNEQKTELVLEVLLEKKEYIKFNFMFFYKKPIVIIFTLLGLYLLVRGLLGFGQLNNFIRIFSFRIFSLLSGVFLTFSIPLMLLIFSNRVYKRDKSMKKSALYKIYKDHYSVERSEGFLNIEWDKLVKIVDTKDFIFIFVTNNVVSIIPKRIFKGREEDLRKFEGILRENCGEILKKRF